MNQEATHFKLTKDLLYGYTFFQDTDLRSTKFLYSTNYDSAKFAVIVTEYVNRVKPPKITIPIP